MSIATEQRVCDYLEKHLFDRIWNEPYKEYRTNVAPRLLTARAVCGTYTPRYAQIDMPTPSDLYFVYSVALEEIAPFRLNVTDWVKLSDYNKDNLLTFQMYTHSGIWLWREGIYMRAGVVNNALLIAVRRDMFKKCCGKSYSPASVYFTKYHDSDMEQSVTCSYVKISSPNTRALAYTSCKNATMVFINGKYSVVAKASDLQMNDYVEAIVDNNVVSKLVIDMQNKRDLTYTSDNSTTRTIIHVPREHNPYNTLITHNTCDIFVIPKSTGTSVMEPVRSGLFVHKCLREDQFIQLTHNDFSVNDSLIGYVAADIPSDSYEMHVFIRTHGKKLGLVRDVNYTDLLYVHDDETILKFLTGTHAVQFEFWKADHLEDSIYAHALMDTTGTRESRDIGYYVDVLGYYNTIQLICQRVIHYKVGSKKLHTFTVPIPTVLAEYNAADMFPIVYLNGIKLDDSLVTNLANESASGDNIEITQTVIGKEWDNKLYAQLSVLKDAKTFSVLLDDSVELNEGDIVAIEVFEKPIICQEIREIHGYQEATGVFEEDTAYFTSSTDRFGNVSYQPATVTVGETIPSDPVYYTNHNRDVEFTDENYMVYKRNTGARAKDANGVESTDLYSYKYLSNPGTWNPNTNVLTLSESLVGSTLMLTENRGIFKVFYDDAWEVSEDSWRAISSGPIMASLEEDEDEFPILGDCTILVFLNGRQLTENLDFVVFESKTSGNLIKREVVLQNLIWLEKTNRIEIYAVRATTRGIQKGYVSGNQVASAGESPFWFDNLSLLVVDGKTISDFESFFGQLFIRSLGHRNGACYLQRSIIPSTAIDIIEKYRNDNDLDRLTRLRAYFVGANEDPKQRIVIPYSHAIFSTYLNSIVRDTVDEDNSFDFEMYEDPEVFEYQFRAYAWLKEIDAAYMRQDLRYLDIYPMYHRFRSKNKLLYKKLKYLFKMLLPTDSIQHKDVING